MNRDQLISHFETLGFAPVETDKYKTLNISPDLVLEKDSIIKAIVIRESSDSLPSTMVERFAQSKRIQAKTLELYFAFPSKPKADILRDCRSFFVGILYVDNNQNIQSYADPKQIKGRKKVNAIPKTQIFFSSRQHLEERGEGSKLLEQQRESLRIPIYPMLVEDDSHYSSDLTRLWEVICRCMDECDFVLIILSGEYREIIDRESRRAIEYFDTEDILFYVKNDRQTKEAWSNLLAHATASHIRYYEYFDLNAFGRLFYARTLQIIKRLHTIHNVPFLAEE